MPMPLDYYGEKVDMLPKFFRNVKLRYPSRNVLLFVNGELYFMDADFGKFNRCCTFLTKKPRLHGRAEF